MISDSRIFSDFMNLIDVSSVDELRLRPAIQVKKDHWFAPDVMQKKPGRPPVGIQGLILDAMDDERISVEEARALLRTVQERLRAADGTNP